MMILITAVALFLRSNEVQTLKWPQKFNQLEQAQSIEKPENSCLFPNVCKISAYCLRDPLKIDTKHMSKNHIPCSP